MDKIPRPWLVDCRVGAACRTRAFATEEEAIVAHRLVSADLAQDVCAGRVAEFETILRDPSGRVLVSVKMAGPSKGSAS